MFALPKLEKKVANGIVYYTDDSIFDVTGVRIAFPGRLGGVSGAEFESLNLGSHVDDKLEDVLKNRELLLEALCSADAEENIPAICNPRQVHGDVVQVATSSDEFADGEEADAVVCDCEGVAPLLCFADCSPVILVASNGVFAVVHAGWRGVVNKISAKAFTTMVEKFGCDPAEINAYVGAHIRSCCFEVGDDVAKIFTDTFGDDVVSPSGEKFQVSMAKSLKKQLLAVGLDESRFCDLEICTMCNTDQFYSYRATDGKCGRHGAIAFRGANNAD
ncbi:MAG: peptidoglycan editing factor PgeF [Phoenicibacter congonensis]|uniref:Purine nucleoside phosphorylase n=1 Tax=Phoenicibacter congonensis TaxID=1944646 RepID=A0AA43RI28_9ACTN|nr:peptidoglycan editing factor PgeF [Phoenicibacter congonensis]